MAPPQSVTLKRPVLNHARKRRTPTRTQALNACWPPSASPHAPAFDPATIETNRGGLCEKCFLAALEAEWVGEDQTEQRGIASYDRHMKRKGMVVRVTAWVHPQGGGDDYQVHWYLKAHPTPEQARDLFRKEGSSCLDDYQIIAL